MATDYNKLKVADLKVELKRLGLPQNGLKADLVSRLEAAGTETPTSDHEAAPAAEVDGTQSEEEAEDIVSSETEPQSAPTALSENSHQDATMTEVLLPSEPELKDAAASVIDSELKPAQAIAATDLATSDVQPQTSMPPSSPNATPLRPVEITQDSQKRKRRSASPPPLADEIAAKRARLNDEPLEVETGVHETDDKEAAPAFDSAPDGTTDVTMGEVQPESVAEPDLLPTNSDQADQTMKDVAKQQPNLNNESSIGGPFVDTHPEEELDRDVEPSVHPATSALYIKNFMRPLRPQAVRDHLLDIATSTGLDVDDQVIPDFYLDNIRTHSFVLFNSVTAAKRVRNALHNRIWPDETNRKPLWIDYIPSDRYYDWVGIERSAGGGRGSGNRYEVVYSHDHDGNVIATLEESDAAPPANKPAPPLEQKQSVPTGPSRGLTGIEGAPTGPRGFQGGGRAQPHPSRPDRVGDYQSTTARPPIAYQPVSEELAQRRLDAMGQAKSSEYDQKADRNKEYRRYFFETGDVLVDRGPEIFLGIRPPHRERERRQDQDRDGRRRGGRGRRNGRRGMPMPHGVPRGGDRYRGPGASSGDHDDRPRYDDRGVDRYHGQNYGRR